MLSGGRPTETYFLGVGADKKKAEASRPRFFIY